MKIDYAKVKEFIEDQKPGTRLYIGCDSERFKLRGEWFADYILAIVVHIEGNKGCKIFGEVQRERDYDRNHDRPRMRLMTEVYKVSELFLELVHHVDFDQYPIEVHLDINPDEQYGSSCVINEATGYIRGVCQVIPRVKPDAFAATVAADNYKRVA